MNIEYIELNDGNKIPNVGFGTFRMSGQECIDAVYNAIKAGYRLIDTAESYANEAEVGFAIAKAIADGICTREELFITTKLNHHVVNNYEKTYKQFEGSLKRLGLDYVDLYLIHYANVTPDARWKAMNAEDWKAMEELKRAGKIKSIGVSNFLQHHLKELLKTAQIIPAVNQLNLNPTWPQEELVKYCKERNILCEAWAPIVIIDNYNKNTMNEMASKYNKSTAQISLRWALQKGFVPLAKTTHEERLKENLNVFDFDIEQSDMNKLDDLVSQACGHDAYPDATYRIWTMYEALNNKNVLKNKKVKLFNLFTLLKTVYYPNKEKTYLFKFIPLIKKKYINQNKSKVYLFGFIRIGTEKRNYQYQENVKLVPNWDKEEPKQKLIKWNAFKTRYYDRLFEYLNIFSDKKPNRFFKHYLKLRYLLTRKVCVSNLDVHITTNCTLKCKDCSHYIPYYPKEAQHTMSLEEYKRYIDIMLKNIDKLYNVLLLGGEPLLHQDLKSFIEYSCSKKQIENVLIVTNGTILPKDELLKSMKNKKVKVIVSNYSINKSLQNCKTKELLELLKQHNIKFSFEETFKFYRQPDINLNDKVTDKIELKNNFYKCQFKYCTILGQGKIYPCAQAKYIDTLNYNMKNDSYIDLLNSNNLRKDFINFYKKDCFSVCECCDMSNYGQVLFPANQIKELNDISVK